MKFYLSLCFYLAMFSAAAQTPADTFKVYKPEAAAAKQISDAVAQASKEGKNILLQIGGNWCSWCRKFYKFSHEVNEVDSLLKENFVVSHINYSKENKNPELLSSLKYPQRFGFPVFVILDETGNLLHIQNTAYLEEGDGYSTEKVSEFLQQWSPGALNPDLYK